MKRQPAHIPHRVEGVREERKQRKGFAVLKARGEHDRLAAISARGGVAKAARGCASRQMARHALKATGRAWAWNDWPAAPTILQALKAIAPDYWCTRRPMRTSLGEPVVPPS